VKEKFKMKFSDFLFIQWVVLTFAAIICLFKFKKLFHFIALIVTYFILTDGLLLTARIIHKAGE
jgi:succinate-acetate transporter protein